MCGGGGGGEEGGRGYSLGCLLWWTHHHHLHPDLKVQTLSEIAKGALPKRKGVGVGGRGRQRGGGQKVYWIWGCF
jgi:hypothetical protein